MISDEWTKFCGSIVGCKICMLCTYDVGEETIAIEGWERELQKFVKFAKITNTLAAGIFLAILSCNQSDKSGKLPFSNSSHMYREWR
jgi:hypothetical protein